MFLGSVRHKDYREATVNVDFSSKVYICHVGTTTLS